MSALDFATFFTMTSPAFTGGLAVTFAVSRMMGLMRTLSTGREVRTGSRG